MEESRPIYLVEGFPIIVMDTTTPQRWRRNINNSTAQGWAVVSDILPKRTP